LAGADRCPAGLRAAARLRRCGHTTRREHLHKRGIEGGEDSLYCPGRQAGKGATVTLNGRGTARLTYQRRKAVGTYEDVYNIFQTPDGAQRQELVSVTVKLGIRQCM
jgi:hypothetical protein